MRESYPDLPGWSFDIEEVSANVYEVRASDETGRGFTVTGTDPDQLLAECRRRAAEGADQ